MHREPNNVPADVKQTSGEKQVSGRRQTSDLEASQLGVRPRVNMMLLTDYAEKPPSEMRQLFRIHLDVPVPTGAFKGLQSALNGGDLETARGIVQTLVPPRGKKGTEERRCWDTIQAVLGA